MTSLTYSLIIILAVSFLMWSLCVVFAYVFAKISNREREHQRAELDKLLDVIFFLSNKEI